MKKLQNISADAYDMLSMLIDDDVIHSLVTKYGFEKVESIAINIKFVDQLVTDGKVHISEYNMNALDFMFPLDAINDFEEYVKMYSDYSGYNMMDPEMERK